MWIQWYSILLTDDFIKILHCMNFILFQIWTLSFKNNFPTCERIRRWCWAGRSWWRDSREGCPGLGQQQQSRPKPGIITNFQNYYSLDGCLMSRDKHILGNLDFLFKLSIYKSSNLSNLAYYFFSSIDIGVLCFKNHCFITNKVKAFFNRYQIIKNLPELAFFLAWNHWQLLLSAFGVDRHGLKSINSI